MLVQALPFNGQRGDPSDLGYYTGSPCQMDWGIKTIRFKDGNTSGNDYNYYDNGNLKEDKNKGIIEITYNHLNLPSQFK